MPPPSVGGSRSPPRTLRPSGTSIAAPGRRAQPPGRSATRPSRAARRRRPGSRRPSPAASAPAPRRGGPRPARPAPQLDRHLRVGDQVAAPVGVGQHTALGGDHYQAVAAGAVVARVTGGGRQPVTVPPVARYSAITAAFCCRHSAGFRVLMPAPRLAYDDTRRGARRQRRGARAYSSERQVGVGDWALPQPLPCPAGSLGSSLGAGGWDCSHWPRARACAALRPSVSYRAARPPMARLPGCSAAAERTRCLPPGPTPSSSTSSARRSIGAARSRPRARGRG